MEVALIRSGGKKSSWMEGTNLVLLMLTERCSGISKKGVDNKGQTVNILGLVGLMWSLSHTLVSEGFIYNPLKPKTLYLAHRL